MPTSPEHVREALAAAVRELRGRKRLSQEEVATFLGVARSALSLMESGQRKVDALELKKLAGLYKRPVGHFTGEEADETAFGADVKHLARKVSDLSSEDREELARFADFLRARKQKKEG